MTRPALPVSTVFALAAMVVLATTCQAPLPDGGGQEQLRGTWLREYSERGVRVRRILSLQADGAFHEKVRIVEASGAVTDYAHEGTWLYDGTNLKRRYTLMNGEPPSRLNVPFATFEIAFESRNEFTGVDHIHGHTVHYRRIGDDAPLDPD